MTTALLDEHHPTFSPSGGLPRALLCPGSVRLVAMLRALGLLTDESSPAAQEGTKLHTYLPPDRDLEELEPEQAAAVKKVRDYIAQRSKGSLYVLYEQPLTFYGPDGQTVLTFGRGDATIVFSNSVEVVDAKFGRAMPSTTFLNVQGATYTSSAMAEHQVERGRFAAVHPRLGFEHVEEYDGLQQVREKIIAIISHALANPTTFNPSLEACRYCPALGWCKASAQSSVDALSHVRPVDAMSAEELASDLEVYELAEHVAEARRSKVKQLLEGGAVVPRWGLEHKDGNREIKDPKLARETVKDVLCDEEMLELMSLPIGEFEKAFSSKWAETRGTTKRKGIEEFTKRLEGVISRKPSKVSLVRIKE